MLHPLQAAAAAHRWPMRAAWGRIATVAVLVATALLAAAAPRPAQSAGLAALRSRLGPRDAALVVTPQGGERLAVHPDLPLVPASTLKLLTSLVALEHLGADHRFTTEFWLDPQRNLIIRGGGDPLLVSETVAAICAALAERLPQRALNDILLDDRFFAQPLLIPGVGRSLEPYDAGNGALCVNFNTVAFARREGVLVSAEPQTPLLPGVLDHVRRSGLAQGRITLPAADRAALLYAGELFRHFLQHHGVACRGRLRPGAADPERDTLIYRHRSETTLEGVLRQLLAHSNNFVANQVLLASGAAAAGPPADLRKAVGTARRYAAERLGIAAPVLAEGSGISRANRLSARNLVRVLQAFAPHRHLMRCEGRERFKTGTLAGVQTRAGYLEDGRGEVALFYAVLVNTPGGSIAPIMEGIRAALPEDPRTPSPGRR
jgi:D-alanyl-D-alanine carboxypeptidase/D-alanyl-D-alanine-endopeptidase (penicillin-binding protein 4)